MGRKVVIPPSDMTRTLRSVSFVRPAGPMGATSAHDAHTTATPTPARACSTKRGIRCGRGDRRQIARRAHLFATCDDPPV